MTVEVSAATIQVPGDQPTIQAGIDASANGDTVLVSAGTYTENINFNGKAITLQSASGAKATIIDGAMLGSVVTLASGETAASTLKGFTIRNGNGTLSPAAEQAGGIQISNASPTITENLITNNVSCNGAGILIADGASPMITRNNIVQNSGSICSGLGGGGIMIFGGGAPRILGNNISHNSQCCSDGGGISVFGMTGVALIANNVISWNSAANGGGINAVNQADANVVQNLISMNTAGNGAGIFWGTPDTTRGPYFVNNTMAGNAIIQSCSSCQGSGLYFEGYMSESILVNNLFIGTKGTSALYCDTSFNPALPLLHSNDAFSSEGTGFSGGCLQIVGTDGNISVLPQFAGAGQFPYELKSGSPAIDSGSNYAPFISKTDLAGNPRIVDGDGNGTAVVDMGAYEYQP